MKIKEVEKEIGISIHTIRFYEEMGLIQCKRDPKSQYRIFDQKDIEKLKEIKLFRSLNISIEKIKNYQSGELTLQELMDHQLRELQAQSEEKKLKEQLCKDIRDSNTPLIPYTVSGYEDVLNHKKNKTPFQEAGSLIASWNAKNISVKRLIFMEILIFPLVWLMTSWVIFFLASIPGILITHTFSIQYPWYAFVITTLIALYLSWSDFSLGLKLPDELYEFHENYISYYNKDTRKTTLSLILAAKRHQLERCYDRLSYDDIDAFKVWFHMVAKTPINGGNVYQIDFYLFSKQGKTIRVNTGMIGVSNEKVKLTAEILKEKSSRVIDPFHILDHLDLDNESFYHYLDNIYWKKQKARLHK